MSSFTSARVTGRVVTAVLASAAALALSACGAATTASDEAPGSRVYESEFGDVTLPEKIERIVSVDFYTPAALMDVGVTPVES